MSKKDKKSEAFNLEDYSNTEVKEEVEYKEDYHVNLDPVVQECIGMPGIRMGQMSCMYGLSDSGKTSLLIHAAIQAQKQGVIPILIITENKMDWARAAKMGLDLSKSKCILREDFEYLEDVYNYISQKIEDVKNGTLPRDVLILWDSVAATPSKESLEIDANGNIKKKYGPQKSASVIGYYNPIIMKRVTSTRRTDSKGMVGLVMLTQAYVKPAEFAGGIATTVPNGGEKIWFPLSLCLEIKQGRQLSATIKGKDVIYATVCKVKVVKNHLTGLSHNGEFVITSKGLIKNDPKALTDYKDSIRSEEDVYIPTKEND
jgi:RecA/RadA recombinase